ncbi:MAG: cobalamin biosynthesis protein CobQ [Ruminococcus sp.]|jgi:hypothetical protein|nr:cobalamin biosynthesis protein CobQ [Ruminococcus sp.]
MTNKLSSENKTFIITGHYGAGKTNVAVNLAVENADKATAIVDLDVVNYYFRTADFKNLFTQKGIKAVISPFFGENSNLDIPALDFDMKTLITDNEILILDVGGDDEGAKVLGRYQEVLRDIPYEMFYVVNFYRYFENEVNEALEMLTEIEKASKLRHTGIINNSNLGDETTKGVVDKTLVLAEKLSRAANLPIVKTIYSPTIYVKKVWE